MAKKKQKRNRITNEHAIKSQMKSVDKQFSENTFTFTGPLTIAEFCKITDLKLNEVVGHFFKQGKMFNANHSLNEDQVVELCLEYSFDFKKETQVDASNFMDELVIIDKDEHLTTRPPIITVMGHVDHGKTTLIDKIRNTKVTAGEAGGITQHTGAYQVNYKGKKSTFLDTPGHAAFTSMRARGAKLTDIVILVVAADDGVMPQTKEAIDHALAAKVPIIVFVNKMDKPGVDPEKVKAELSKNNITTDEWGGDYQFVYGSALKGDGIDNLFEAINLQAEMMELKANDNRQAIGTVIESHIDKGQGITTTLVVTNGTLRVRDFIVAGSNFGKIKILKDTHGKIVRKIGPGQPAIITGLKNIPEPGDKFYGFIDEKFAKNLAEEKTRIEKQKELVARTAIKNINGVNVINIIIKSDVQGTAEAVKHSLAKVENDEFKVHIVSSSVGDISKNDISLAVASNSIIYAFNSKPSSSIINLAKQEGIEIKSHTIIYKMIEEVEALLKGKMAPKYEKKYVGEAQIIKVIVTSKFGNIAGSMVQDGKVVSRCFVEVIRNSKVIHEGRLDSLQRGPDSVKEVAKGKDFGCHIYKFNDIKEGDFIKCYIEQKVN